MKFEKLSVCPNAVLPYRSTENSAGYDFKCYADTLIPPYQIMLIPTGIKCQIDEGYYLQLALRSSTPMKKHLMLANGIGIIDSDYYNNPDNEGHIFIKIQILYKLLILMGLMFSNLTMDKLKNIFQMGLKKYFSIMGQLIVFMMKTIMKINHEFFNEQCRIVCFIKNPGTDLY